jgi:hypothetical protein
MCELLSILGFLGPVGPPAAVAQPSRLCRQDARRRIGVLRRLLRLVSLGKRRLPAGGDRRGGQRPATVRRLHGAALLAAAVLGPAAGGGSTAAEPAVPRLAAETFDSGFPLSHDSYNSMGVGSDGKIYYVLSTESLDVGAAMFAFDPATRRIHRLADLTEVCGEGALRAIPQGKSHVNFVESRGKLYFATHVGYYTIRDGMEKMGVPPAGYRPYPGGHILACDLVSGRFQDLAKAPGGEGILTLAMDPRRQRIYCLTWPRGHFLRYDLSTGGLKDFGALAGKGEDGTGPDYYTLCRAIAVDPGDGSAYLTLSTGTILRYRHDRDRLEPLSGEDLRKDYFGLYDPHCPGHMGYNWRQIAWQPDQRVFYGVHGNSGYLFRFDPRAECVEVLDRITSAPSRRSGMFDQFSYGYLGFALGPDGHTLYYLTGGPVYLDGRRLRGKPSTAKGESKGVEDLHLVTYDTRGGECLDRGAIFFPDGRRPEYVNSIAVGGDGAVYSLSRITQRGHTRADLFCVRPSVTTSCSAARQAH